MSESKQVKPAAAGWYPHPTMVKTRRYWDGSSWTQHIAASADAAATRSPSDLTLTRIADAHRVASAINIIKWVVISLLVLVAVVVVTVALLGAFVEDTFLGGALISGAAVVLVCFLYSLFVWVTLGWAEHTLEMLATVARNTSRL